MTGIIDVENVSKCLSAFPLFQRVNDLDETCTRVGEAIRPHSLKVLGVGHRLNARMDRLPLNAVTIHRLSYQAEVSVVSDPPDNFFLLMLPLREAAEVQCKRENIISTREVAVIVDSTATLSMRWSKNCEQLMLRIDRETLERTCEAQLGHPLDSPIQFEPKMDMRTEGGMLCGYVMSFIAANPFFVHSVKKYPMVSAHLEQSLMNTLLVGQPNQYLDEILAPTRALLPGYVKRAEEYLLAHAHEPFTMRDVANHLGVSLRSLYAGFQRYRNMSPKAFLRNARLDRVHAELVAARQEGRDVTVTQIAMSLGFTHLGHFTKAYFAKYNELPSVTLRKYQKSQ